MTVKGRPCTRTGGKKKDEKDTDRWVAFLVETWLSSSDCFSFLFERGKYAY